MGRGYDGLVKREEMMRVPTSNSATIKFGKRIFTRDGGDCGNSGPVQIPEHNSSGFNCSRTCERHTLLVTTGLLCYGDVTTLLHLAGGTEYGQRDRQ